MKKKKYEVTRIGVRDDKVVNKGKTIVAIGAIVTAIGVGTIMSGRQWYTPDNFYAQIGGPNDEDDDE